MKVSKRDILLLVGFLGILAAVCSYFFVFQPTMEKSDALEQENMEHLTMLTMEPPIPKRNICVLKRQDASLSMAASELEKLVRQTKGNDNSERGAS